MAATKAKAPTFAFKIIAATPSSSIRSANHNLAVSQFKFRVLLSNTIH